MKKRITKMLAFAVSLVLIMTALFSVNLAVATAATAGTCGDSATWSYDSATTTLTISGTGATKDYNAMLSKAPWTDYKSSITTVVVNEGITEIGNYSFYNCTALTSVSLPSTLVSLHGSGTMTTSYGCFQGCTALTSITLPEGLESIGNCAFKDCTALKGITLPNSLTALSYGAFSNCTALVNVTFGNGLTETGSNSFYNSGVKNINWSDSITTVSSYSFYGFQGTELNFPENITYIGYRAFADNYFLKKVTVNNANTQIATALNTEISSPFAGHEQDNVTIYGHKGSTAESFAAQFSYPFVSLDECDHETTHEVIKLEATCTETGILQNVCDNCGAVVSETAIAALGHDYAVTETVDNTEIDGHIYTSETCTRCGDVRDTVEHQKAPEGSATKYIWKDGYYTYTNSATCTTPGTEKYTCTVEGCCIIGNIATYETLSASLGSHNVEEYTVTATATCTAEGSQEGVCTICGETVTKTIPATGHGYTEDNLLETIDNTAEDGHIHRIYQCQNCAEQIDEPEHIEWIEGFYTASVITEPRCVINGAERDTCDICAQTRTVTIPANGQHEWYVTTATEPSCTIAGRINYACKNCSLTKSEEIEKLGHDYVIVEENCVAATCTTAGYDYYKCAREGCSVTKQQTIAALGHTADEYTVTAEPSCEETGSKVGVCTRVNNGEVCGETFTVTLDALGHNYEDVVADLTGENKPGHSLVTPTCTRCGSTTAAAMRHDEWIEGYYTNTSLTSPTCTIRGTTKDTCTICNTARTNYIPALGHNYNYTGELRCDGMRYRCSICLASAYIDANEVFGYWNPIYVNSKSINRTGTDITSYLDANGDGIINGKDYAIIKNAAKNMPLHTYEDTVTPPTCTAEGYTTHTCSVCGDAYTSDYTAIDENAHSFSENEQYCLNGCGTENPDYIAPAEETAGGEQ